MNMIPSLRNCRWEDLRGLNWHGMSPEQQEDTVFLERCHLDLEVPRELSKPRELVLSKCIRKPWKDLRGEEGHDLTHNCNELCGFWGENKNANRKNV